MIYIFVFLLSLFFFALSDFFLDKKKGLGYFMLIIAILIPCILAGCRDLSIGTDTSFYVRNYFRIAKHSRNFDHYYYKVPAEIGYAVFNYLIAGIFKNIHWLLFFIQLFITSFIALTILNFKRRGLLPWAFLVYFLLYYSNSLNMTRQTMAIAVCLYSFSNLLNGRTVKALIFAFLAVAFHYSAVIFFGMFALVFYTSKFTRNFWLFQLIVSFTCISVIILLDQIIAMVIGVGAMDQGFDTYSSTGVYGSNIPISELFLCVIFFGLTILFRRQFNESVENKNLYQSIFLVSFVFCFAALKSTFAIRGMYYFSYMSIIIFPILIENIEKKNAKRFFVTSVISLFLLYWALTIPYANLGETYPYKSKILNL